MAERFLLQYLVNQKILRQRIKEIIKEYKDFASNLPPGVVVTKKSKIVPFDYIVKEGDIIEINKLAISQN